MSTKHCELCDKKVSELLSHLHLHHGIENPEGHEKQKKLKEENDGKEEKYHQKIRDLVAMRKSKEISVEEYKSRIVTIKID